MWNGKPDKIKRNIMLHTSKRKWGNGGSRHYDEEYCIKSSMGSEDSDNRSKMEKCY